MKTKRHAFLAVLAIGQLSSVAFGGPKDVKPGTNKPAPANKPAPVNQPAPTNQLVPTHKPSPANKPSPASKPAPVAQPAAAQASSENRVTFGGPGTYAVKDGHSLTVRTHAMGVVMGRLLGAAPVATVAPDPDGKVILNPGRARADRFVVSRVTPGGWGFGHLAGKPNRQGWIMMDRERLTKLSTRPPEGESFATPVRFDEKWNLQIAREGAPRYTTNVKAKNPDQKTFTIYGNVSASGLRDVIARAHTKHGLNFRYRAGPYALVLKPGAKMGQGIWGWVRLSELAIPAGTIGLDQPFDSVPSALR